MPEAGLEVSCGGQVRAPSGDTVQAVPEAGPEVGPPSLRYRLNGGMAIEADCAALKEGKGEGRAWSPHEPRGQQVGRACLGAAAASHCTKSCAWPHPLPAGMGWMGPWASTDFCGVNSIQLVRTSSGQ